jgi:hypothetical protein
MWVRLEATHAGGGGDGGWGEEGRKDMECVGEVAEGMRSTMRKK